MPGGRSSVVEPGVLGLIPVMASFSLSSDLPLVAISCLTDPPTSSLTACLKYLSVVWLHYSTYLGILTIFGHGHNSWSVAKLPLKNTVAMETVTQLGSATSVALQGIMRSAINYTLLATVCSVVRQTVTVACPGNSALCLGNFLL